MTVDTQWTPDAVFRLRSVLAELYTSERDARLIVTDLGWPPAQIGFHPEAINTWFAVLEYAKKRKAIDAVLFRALADYPENDTLLSLKNGQIPAFREGAEARDWQGAARPKLEALTGQVSSLVPISFLEIGLERARAVARVAFIDGSSGSGFLIADNILITNHHVLHNPAEARTASAQFNYQLTTSGTVAAADVYRFDPDRFFRTSPEDDWTAVALEDNPSSRWGRIDLQIIKVDAGDRVNIIQHPGGGYKQIAYFSNIVAYAGAGRVQYLTDTLPGSSGSPVFDRNWDVVALHRSGGWQTEPGGNTVHYRNEGIAIDRIIRGLA